MYNILPWVVRLRGTFSWHGELNLSSPFARAVAVRTGKMVPCAPEGSYFGFITLFGLVWLVAGLLDGWLACWLVPVLLYGGSVCLFVILRVCCLACLPACVLARLLA